MKKMIFTNWTFMRFLRLGMGIAIIVQAFMVKDMLFGFLGLLLTAMPVFNIGCCGTQGCYMPPAKEKKSEDEIIYEEVV
ncbi:MAG: hypothetical protein JNM14_05230 [Ferruginibacter sp.]|nr:hypothetical protein [Ferruginibacter sp.]